MTHKHLWSILESMANLCLSSSPRESDTVYFSNGSGWLNAWVEVGILSILRTCFGLSVFNANMHDTSLLR